MEVKNSIGRNEICRATDTYPAHSYDGKTEWTVLCTGEGYVVGLHPTHAHRPGPRTSSLSMDSTTAISPFHEPRNRIVARPPHPVTHPKLHLLALVDLHAVPGGRQGPSAARC